MRNKPNDFGLFFWVHCGILIFVYLTPVLIRWQIIALLFALFYCQIKIFGNCILTSKELRTDDPNASFYFHYLSKLGLRLDLETVNRCVLYGIPPAIFLAAIFWQVALNHRPLIF